MQESNTPIPASEPPQPTGSASGNGQLMGILSIVLAVIGSCLAFFFFICGVPIQIVSAVLGYLAFRDPQSKTLGIIGLAINGLSLLLYCALVSLGFLSVGVSSLLGQGY